MKLVTAVVSPASISAVSVRARRALAVAVLLALAACGDGTDSDADSAANAPASPTPAAGAIYRVDVDANTSDSTVGRTINASRYFPKAVQVHPGDTLIFDLQDSGDPHTVAMGTLVDKAAAAAEKAGGPQDGPPPAEVLAVPQLFPQGPGDAIQAGAQPCFQAEGPAPLEEACPVKTGDWTGEESLVSSGWMTGDEPFTLKIGDDMAPGTYTYFCQLHGPQMSGTVEVVDKATPIPPPEEVRAAAKAERDAEIALLQPALAALDAATDSEPLAGALSPETMDSYVAAFGPEDIKIPVGGSVTWTLQGLHTIEVEAPADAQALRVAAPDGSVHINTKVVMPIGGPGFGEKPGPADGGAYAGGFRNSGLGISFPPMFSTYTLKFPKAGTYKILCGVHEGMKGTVTVG